MEGTIDYTGSVDVLFTMAEKAITMVVGQPLLLTFVVAGLAFTGIAIFKKLK